jgi:hypothetical protein
LVSINIWTRVTKSGHHNEALPSYDTEMIPSSGASGTNNIRCMGIAEKMALQFWTNKVSARRDEVVPTESTDSALMPPLVPQATACRVATACAAFHTAHEAIVAVAAATEEIDNTLCEQHLDQRDWALKQVRAQAARTRPAWEAKVLVLNIMQDWFGSEDPDLVAFALEIVCEAAALFENDRGRACHREACEAFEPQSQRAERRNPFAWFARSLAKTSEAPFAN